MDSPDHPTKLSDRERCLIRISGALATGEPDRVRFELESARSAAPAREVEEVLLQCHLFLGFPAVIGALTIWREVDASVTGRDEVDDGAEEEPGRDQIRRRGEELCRRIYGSAYESLRSNIRALHPALDRWMVEDGYGKVLGRPGLDPRTRELAVVGLLAVSAATAQLHSHLRGAVRVGASPERVDAALEAVREFMGEEEAEVAERTWNRVRERL